METQDGAICEIPETEARPSGESESETTRGAVEHNNFIGNMQERLPRATQARQPKVDAPGRRMVEEELIERDRKTEGADAPDNDAELIDALMGRTFEEKPLWTTLWENMLDALFPRKLPPLELTSKPVPVPDRMAVKTNPWAVGFSTSINVAILLVLLFFVGKKVIQQVTGKQQVVTVADVKVSEFQGAKQKQSAGGGGGGGNNSPVEASKGHLPKFEKDPLMAPKIAVVEHPKLAMEPAINVQTDLHLPDNPSLPNIGMKNSANVRLASEGSGSGGGMGSGRGGGMGSGRGNGYGPGSGGNTGGGVYRLGGGDTKAVLVYSVDPEFSDEARRNKYQGICLITLIVDAQGNPQNPRVVRPLGMGLDEKALEAVRKYKFKPALKGGHTPVPTQITIEVNFRLY